MIHVPDHPIIQNMEASGWPTGREPPVPVCPFCGEECETAYLIRGSVAGCEHCVDERDAYDILLSQDGF